MERLTKTCSHGTHRATDTLPCGENSWDYKALLLERLGAYEDTGLTPEEIMDVLTLTDWVKADKRLPRREEWIGTKGKEHYLRRMEIAVESDTLEYFLVFYDGYKWFDKFGRTYAGVKAWKIHEPFNPQN